jgi:hypothetical protein
MKRAIGVTALLLATAVPASAQPLPAGSAGPAAQFHAIGTTGDLLTTRSRAYWTNLEHLLRSVETVTGVLTRNYGVPVVRLGRLMTSGSPTPSKPMSTAVWLAGPWLGGGGQKKTGNSSGFAAGGGF